MAEQTERLERLEEQVSALEAQVHVQEDRFRSMQEVAVALGSTLVLDDLLALIMNAATRLLAAERSTLFLLDDTTGELWSKIAQGSIVQEIRLQPGVGIAGHVAATGEVVNIQDAYADDRFQKDWDIRNNFRTRAVLCAPVRTSQGKIIGVIQVLNKKSGPFVQNDENLLTALASQAAVSLENSKLFQSLLETQRELKRRMFELEFLFGIEQSLHRHQSQEEMMRSVIGRTLEVLGAEAGAILLSGERVAEIFFRSPGSAAVRNMRVATNRGIAAWVANEGTPLLSNSPADLGHGGPLAEVEPLPMESILCVPLIVDATAVGAFEIVNKRGGFTQEDLKMLTLVTGLIADEIELTRSREAREKANRLADVGQMLSGVLHDFKTPIAIVSNYVRLMAEEKSKPSRLNYRDIVLRQFDNVNIMIQEILAFARGESQVLLRKVYLHKFIGDFEEQLAAEFAAHRIELKIDQRYRGVARFDEGKMRRAIFNIARNAIEAMPDGGTFSLVVDTAGSDLVFHFQDTGRGIPEEIQDKLFESFVTKGKANGTGLGLAIVKKIVNEHGGEITFSTAPGKGTSFRLRLPLDPEGAKRAQ
jgi:signal transduction histidine kinase